MINKTTERRLVGLAVVLYAVLALTFSLGPIFEGPDEIEHYRYVRTLVRTQALPDLYGQVRGEYHQPPLYYALAAPLVATLDDGDFDQIDGHLNPFYGARIHMTGSDNKNLYLHRRAEEFPYDDSETALRVHLLRLFSVALGACTLLTAYGVFGLLWPQQPGRRLLALGVIAAWPQFAYIASVISNDSLLNLLATIVLYLLLRRLRDGASWQNAAWLGVALGALLLTKVSAVFIAIPVALTIVPDRRAWRYAPLTLAIVIALAGWWYIHNWIENGDPTNSQVVLETWKEEVIRPGELALDVGVKRLRYSYESLWARFGQGAIAVPDGIAHFYNGLTILALGSSAIHAGWWLWRARRTRLERKQVAQAALIAVFGLIWVAGLLYWASMAWSGNQGRYLLPGIAAWGALAAFGLGALVPLRWRVPFALAAWVPLFGVALFAALGTFRTAYEISPVPDEITNPLTYNYEGQAELIGAEPVNVRARPGDTVEVTLYWRALRPTTSELLAYLHSAESDVVRRDSHPATGNLLSTDWQAGEIWAETYWVEIPANATTQQTYPLLAGLYDPVTERPLDATNPAGESITPVIGRIAINGSGQPLDTAYWFGDQFALAEPQITRTGDQLEICLQWRVLRESAIDYNLFVHLRGDNGATITQADMPAGGDYPTGAWARSEVVAQCVTLDAPSGNWHVALGLYNLTDFIRLPLVDASGQHLTDDMLILEPES